MKTIILPGYSLSNREWAEEVKRKLGEKNKAFVHEWKHWATGEQKDFSVEGEAKKILSEVGSGSVNIIAKSIGTLVAATLLNKQSLASSAGKIAPQINKLILCGIPSAFIKDNKLEDESYFGLKKLSPDKVVVFQNEKDPLASFEKIKEMFSKIDPQIKVIEKDREDHDYPFYSDFEKILSD